MKVKSLIHCTHIVTHTCIEILKQVELIHDEKVRRVVPSDYDGNWPAGGSSSEHWYCYFTRAMSCSLDQNSGDWFTEGLCMCNHDLQGGDKKPRE